MVMIPGDVIAVAVLLAIRTMTGTMLLDPWRTFRAALAQGVVWNRRTAGLHRGPKRRLRPPLCNSPHQNESHQAISASLTK